MKELLGTGPPVYWVTKGSIDYFDSDVNGTACGGSGCDPYSISMQLYMASKQPNT